jgi:hypothetical protein
MEQHNYMEPQHQWSQLTIVQSAIIAISFSSRAPPSPARSTITETIHSHWHGRPWGQMRSPMLLIRLWRNCKHIREVIWCWGGALCGVVDRWEIHQCSISILKRLRVWMARGWWKARSSVGGRTESRMPAIMIRRNVVDHWRWRGPWRFCGSWRSDGGLRRLLAAPTPVELMGCFING